MTISRKRMAAFSAALGKRIAEIRVGRGMTQEALAAKLDSAKEVVSRIERGNTVPSLNRLAEIADALDVDVWDLFAGTRPSERDPHAATIAALARLLRERPVPDGEMLLRVAAGMFGEDGFKKTK